jgi:large subunit ribosomal protein L34e
VTYRRQTPYHTPSNRTRVVKTPGGRMVAHVLDKSTKGVHCPCGVRLNGVARQRPADFRRLPKFDRTVSRAYGGSLCHKCTKDKIMRAFIVEEQKVLKQVLLEQVRAKKSEGTKKRTK